MTFKEALQAEINLQGLSVAQIATDSSVSKGAIYNILNGTTEDARIRPATRKAIASACNRDVRADGDGVVFVEIGMEPVAAVLSAVHQASVVLTWLSGRPFLKEDHAGPAFDWLHTMEEQKQLSGIRLVDRVYQNRPDFLSVAVHNKGKDPVLNVSIDLSVTYAASGPRHSFSTVLSEACLPGRSLEETVFVCAGAPFTLVVDRAQLTTASGEQRSAQLPDPFLFAGGHVD